MSMSIDLKTVEVVLKKVRLTKSILNQATIKQFDHINLDNYDVIGWYADGKKRFVVLYNSESNSLIRTIFIYKARLLTEHETLREIPYDSQEVGIKFHYSDRIEPQVEIYENLEEANKRINRINSFVQTISEKGQFYV